MVSENTCSENAQELVEDEFHKQVPADQVIGGKYEELNCADLSGGQHRCMNPRSIRDAVSLA